MDWAQASGILGVKENATPEEIKARWRYWASILHPDKTRNLSDRMREEATQDFKSKKDAYDFLIIAGNNPFTSPLKLEIKPKHIRFRDVEPEQKKSTTFEISSIGGPYTNIWIDNETPEWLTIISVKSTTSEQLPLEVTLESNGIGEPDHKYSCDILVRLENEKTNLKAEEKVHVELWIKSEPALITAYPNNFEDTEVESGSSEKLTFKLSNPGRGHLKGMIIATKPWLVVEPTTINVPPLKDREHTVTVMAFSLSNGFEDSDSIQLNSNAGNYSIPISISVVDTDVNEDFIADDDGAEASQRPFFSLKAFWRTIAQFLLWPFYLCFITVPLGFYLFDQSVVGAWGWIITYGVVAFVVAFVRGDSQGRKETLINGPRQNAPNITGSRDIFAPSVKNTRPGFVVVNKSSGYFHRDGCKLAQVPRGKMAQITRDQAIIHGFKACSVCKP